MGGYLSEPIKTKSLENGTVGNFEFCCVQMQGWRQSMEDTFISRVNIQEDIHLFGVLDGHGGAEVAKFVQKNFPEELYRNVNFQKRKFDIALEETFVLMDELLMGESAQRYLKSMRLNDQILPQKENYAEFVGCTATIALFVGHELYVANAGDCRCFLQREDELLELSDDHLPYHYQEARRILNAGGFVDSNGRLNGTLSVSRAIGDFEFKNEKNLSKEQQMLLSFPDVRKINLKDSDNFVFLGCDGVFEKLGNNFEVAMYLENKIKNIDIQQSVSELFDASIAPNLKDKIGCDNMTAILIKLK